MQVTMYNTGMGLDFSSIEPGNFGHRLLQLLEAISLPEPEWEGQLTVVSSCLVVFRIVCPYGEDNVTKEPLYWESRPWMLSDKQDNGEILRTVWLATMTTIEHEFREKFLYQGERVMDPHFKLEDAVQYAQRRRLDKEVAWANVNSGAMSAISVVARAQRDLPNHDWTEGMTIDLLMDNFPQWSSEYINKVVARMNEIGNRVIT